MHGVLNYKKKNSSLQSIIYKSFISIFVNLKVAKLFIYIYIYIIKKQQQEEQPLSFGSNCKWTTYTFILKLSQMIKFTIRLNFINYG